MSRILVIDDEGTILRLLKMVLESRQYEVTTSGGGEESERVLMATEYDLLLSDIRMQPYDGLHFLKMAHEKWPTMPVVMMTGFATMDSVKQAVSLGAFDYIRKPFKVNDLLEVVDRAIQYGKALKVKGSGVPCKKTAYYIPGVVAESAMLKQACELVKRVAPTMTTVLICGEQGVGKQLVARTIHAMSRRKDKPFVSIDCSKVDAATLVYSPTGRSVGDTVCDTDQGTLLFERIDSASPPLQELLLELVRNKGIPSIHASGENQPIDVRILAATETDLGDLVDAGIFIEELHDRIRLIPIAVPPLRERREDILPIAQSILEREAGSGTVSVMDGEVADALTFYSWPGNAAELETVLLAMLRSCADGRITREMLPAPIAEEAGKNSSVSIKFEDSRFKSLKMFLQASGRGGTPTVVVRPQGTAPGDAPADGNVTGS